MESVLSQDGPELEYLVVDPGSTDHTPEVIDAFRRKYPGRIIHIVERDNGPADGMNKAFARATGDVFGYLNADDFYLPGCFRRAAAALKDHPEASAIYGDGYRAAENGEIRRRVISTSFSARRFVYGGALVLQQSTFYRAGAFHAVGGFNVENRTSWDAELLLDMALKSMSIIHVPGFWSVFRIHSESITGSQRLANESRNTHARYFRTVMGRDRNWIDRVLSKMVLASTLLVEPRGLAARVMDRLWAVGRKLPSTGVSDAENLVL